MEHDCPRGSRALLYSANAADRIDTVSQVPTDLSVAGLDDAGLEDAIAAQKQEIVAFEQEFVPLRRRYERLRKRLRDLEGERERRSLAAAGRADTFKPIPRRSITVADAVAGRERALPMDVPLSSYEFASVRRQAIILHPAGDRARQRLTFYRQTGDDTAEASTFAEAQRLLEAGWQPGVSGVALNRMAVYYPETATPGWLRLDQMYFEEPMSLAT